MQPVLVMLLGAWVGGISLGVLMDGVGWLLLSLAGLLAFAQSYRLPFVVAVALMVVVSAGYVYGDTTRSESIVGCVPSEQAAAARVVARPDIREDSVRYLLEDNHSCRYFVYSERWPVHDRGTVVAVTGGKFRSQANIAQEEPGFGQYLVRHEVAGVWSYPTLTIVTMAETDRQYQAIVARVHRLFPEPDASLIGALLFAERGQLPEETLEHFRRTSLTHILSISGAHISLLTGLFIVLVSPLSLTPRFKTSGVLVLLWAYIWFVGAPVAAVRAGFFWSGTLIALRLGLLVSLPTAAILTLSLLVTWQPLIVLDLGLKLSFLAVIGIFLALFVSKPWRMRLAQQWHGVTVALLVSVGATLTTWPLISHSFGTISLSAPVANLLVLPAVPVIMSGSALALFVSFFSFFLARLLGVVVHMAVWWMLQVAEWLGSLPGSWLTGMLPGWVSALYYVGLCVFLIAVVRSQGRSWREIWE